MPLGAEFSIQGYKPTEASTGDKGDHTAWTRRALAGLISVGLSGKGAPDL
jgi:hypothetical protein